MLRGYADAHVVLALIQALRQRGMDVVRVQDRGREQADDADLLDEALADERVMLTNDMDFLVLAAERGTRQERFAPIFFSTGPTKNLISKSLNCMLSIALGLSLTPHLTWN